MLTAPNCLLLVVDVQESLANVMFRKDNALKNIAGTIQGAKILGIPILWTEQAPQKIGKTVPSISALLSDLTPIEKITFSCCADAKFMQALGSFERKQILIVGIEAHVCVYQTAMDLVNLGYDVHVVADAVSSRTEENRSAGLGRIKDLGAGVTTTEMALCELLKVAEGEKFKQIIKLIK